MADDAGTSLKGRVSAEEWQARVDCAALYRLVALHGWDDMIFTHISMRVPGPDHHFLINPYGMLFEEITASSLVKVDLEGAIVAPTPYYINPAGFTIHSAIHAAREDALCVIHLHTDAGVGVSAQKEGLLPLTQNALMFDGRVGYHEYEGPAVTPDEIERLGATLGDNAVLFLRSHGCLIAGRTIAEAFTMAHDLHRACDMQIALLSCGGDNIHPLTEESRRLVRERMAMPNAKAPEWPGLLRRLDRTEPDYKL